MAMFRPRGSGRSITFRSRRRQKGFTLIEVSISMLLVVVGILPMIVLLLLARHVDDQAKIQAAAYNIARQEIDTVKAQSWSDRKVGTTTSFTIPSSIAAEFPNQSLAGTYTVLTSNATFPALQQIVVRVSWTNSSSVSGSPGSSITVDTLAAQGAGE